MSRRTSCSSAPTPARPSTTRPPTPAPSSTAPSQAASARTPCWWPGSSPTPSGSSCLSIPRDLWLPIAGTGSEDRINTAYSNGRQTLIDTIQESLGIPINHYIEVDFSGFQRLVEAIGGVPMWFDTAMRDQHTGLVINGEGCVTLDGQQALALARSRSLEYVEDGDGTPTPPATWAASPASSS